MKEMDENAGASRNTDVCIIGAGLSGTYAANELLEKNLTVTVVDSRDRIGGRLLTASQQGGGDLGGAWIWPNSEKTMCYTLQENEMEIVSMYLEGDCSFMMGNGQRHVMPSGTAGQYAACGSGAIRVCGGASTLVDKLLSPRVNLLVELNTCVTQIEYTGEGAQLTCQSTGTTETKILHCRVLILAAPPKVLANTIKFCPSLPKVKYESMMTTPTWMEDYGKVAVSFSVNWWRQRAQSGISIDQQGAVQTWWEACSGIDGDGNKPTLAGFVAARGAKCIHDLLSEKGTTALHDYILQSLQRLYNTTTFAVSDEISSEIDAEFGSPDKEGLVITRRGITVTYKSWKGDPYTNANLSPSHNDFECDYGDISLQQSIGPLFFAGTETCRGHGHMEGAVLAAQRVVGEVEIFLNNR